MKDPVCGMDVDEKKAPATSSYKGKQIAFCGQPCKEKFDKAPEQYAHGMTKQHHEQHEKAIR